jgi:hypothetical protein
VASVTHLPTFVGGMNPSFDDVASAFCPKFVFGSRRQRHEIDFRGAAPSRYGRETPAADDRREPERTRPR